MSSSSPSHLQPSSAATLRSPPPTVSTPLLYVPSRSKERLNRGMDRSLIQKLLDPAVRNYLTGIALILAVVSLWTISSFITSDLFAGGYNKPFLVTYLNTSAFSLYLIPFFYKRHFPSTSSSSPDPPPPTNSYEPLPTHDRDLSTTTQQSQRRERRSMSRRSLSPIATLHMPLSHAGMLPSDGPDVERLSERETAGLALMFCGFWFVANWSVNASLEWTSVGSSTILASMSGFFTLGIGRLFHVETFTKSKLVAVTISFTGVILVSLADHFSTTILHPSPSKPIPTLDNNTLPYTPSDGAWSPSSYLLLPEGATPSMRIWGDSLALLSAFFYAAYVVLLKVKIGEETRINMQLFFAFVGLFNFLLLWPVGLVLHFLGWETLELPVGKAAWLTMAFNMGITLISDYIYVIAMLKTTPLVVTIGLSLTIPFAVLGDFVRGTSTGGLQSIAGAILVLVSFSAMGFEGAAEVEEEEERLGAAGIGPRGRRRSGGERGGGSRREVEPRGVV
ncbi:hypothetical protein BDY24DRAFT_359690 [Mrakia frigida]|uniref:DMT family transporter n=1 Tax=Mrakia frigida TaxID=29902 RepID=UPI003FCC2494